MDRKLRKLMESGNKIPFILLVLFAAATIALKQYVVAAIEIALIILAGVLFIKQQRKRKEGMRKYIEALAFQVDDASKSSLVTFPLPMIIIHTETGEIVWGNDYFYNVAGIHDKFYETHMTNVVPGFDTRWLMEGSNICPYDVELGGRKFNIYGNMVNGGGDKRRSLLATLFWVDITDFALLREKYEKTKPVVAVIMLDSYEEITKGMSEAEKSNLTAEVDKIINGWAGQSGGIIRRLERDRYLFIFEQKDLVTFTADKFAILEEMHSVKNSDGIMATLSIGIGKGEHTLLELYQQALLCIDMALSRGGDQVVIKTKTAFEFYGGRSKEVEKRTKVKSRVTANALRQLIRDSSNVFIMGHKMSDLDSIGASAGIAAATRKLGKDPYIIVDYQASAAPEMLDKLRMNPKYDGVFISEADALEEVDSGSLLVVVDTSRPEIVEAPKLLSKVQKIAVVDHHRRAASYIDNAAISLHETYASSASELVSELLQYIVTVQDVENVEAEAMLGGIFLDTKGFTIKTGVRTFEAAAYLRQLGADTIEVRKMFSGDLNTYIRKYGLISNARQVFPGISLAVTSEQESRIVAGQAADDLINVADTFASFVIFGEGSGTALSARSYGKVNVQVICEKIGGGGQLTGAGAQFTDKTPFEVEPIVINAIREYLEESPITQN